MFVSRLQSLLGSVPVSYRSYPDSKRRYRRKHASVERDFFGTSGMELDPDQVRRREVNKLFARMRSELQDISVAFKQESEDYLSCLPVCRQGLLLQMLVASDYVADELDHVIATLCFAGNEAEQRGRLKQVEGICNSVLVYSRLRLRFNEFQHELNSMLFVLIDSAGLESLATGLNFDPIAQDKPRGRVFVDSFLKSVDESVSVLTELAAEALRKREFEIAAQLCSCNLQLTGFLDDAYKILSLAIIEH